MSARVWSAQGFGMLRAYLPGNRRIHVWTRRVAVHTATTLHTHPWDFRSVVLRGMIHNFKFRRMLDGPATHAQYRLKCGEGACVVSDPTLVRLCQVWAEIVSAGGEYAQTYDEIHESAADEGTVTLITRTLRAEADYAQTFVPVGREFVSAEPRPATPDEVQYAERAIAGLVIP